MRVNVLGVPVDDVTMQEAILKTWEMFAEPRCHVISTPNPEIIVTAQKNEDFRAALGRADLAIPDGTGLVWAARRMGAKKARRIAGADFVVEVCKIAAELGKSVFFIGGAEGVAKAAANALYKRLPKLRVAGVAGGDIKRRGKNQWVMASHTLESARVTAPDILFVALGHAKQELFIEENMSVVPSVRVAMGVGGALDFLSGKKMRAPKWMRDIGFEWLFRLFQEPWRWRRIVDAVIVFPWLVLTQKSRKL